MKVQVINKEGDVIWDFDVSRPPDDSGNSWRNDDHVIMSGILYTLRRAVIQAEEFPK